MKALRSHCHWLAALCLGVLPVARAGAQLADNSPFLPTAGAAGGGAAAAAENGPLELRGIMPTPEGPRFCIYDVANKSSKWVGLNETGSGNKFVVKSADPDHDSVSILSDGRILTLTLRKARVAPFNPANGRDIIGPMVVGGGWVNPVVLNPTASDEQRRLQSIAEEVRRRRLAREQADRAAATPGSPPPGASYRQQ